MNSLEILEKHQCRTCYNTTKGLRHLQNVTECGKNQESKTFFELLSEVSRINIMEDSCKEMPQYICDGCSRKLKAAYAFIQQTHEVHERLMTIMIDRGVINKHLDCLQESQVDIESCLEIKMEDGEVVSNADTKRQSHIDLKFKDKEVFTENNNFNFDVMCKDTYDRINAVESKEQNYHRSDQKHADEENAFQKNPIIKVDKLKPQIDVLNDEVSANSDSDRDSHDYQSDVSERQKEDKDINKKNTKSSFSEELDKKHIEDEDVAIPCTQCNKIFNNSKALARHKRTSHIPEEQKCTCPLCFRKFSRSCNMYTHMRTFHGPDTVPLKRKPSTEDRTFQCEKCPRNYTKKKHLNIHIKNKHSPENEGNKQLLEISVDNLKIAGDETNSSTVKSNKPKRYEVRSLCSICGSSFSSKTHLIVHMRRHTGERPFKCDLCDRAYPRISELTCHRRIHTGEKPFACKICGKTFRVSSKMTTHMRSHTDVRPYKCSQCERSFKYSKDLSIHFRIHTGERPYKCNICGSTFTQSNTLKAHRVKLGHMDNLGNNCNNLS